MAKYAGFRYANLIDWSPSARGMLIWTPTDKGLQFQFLDGPRHAGAPLAPFPTGTRQVALFNPVDPKTFVFVRDTSGGKELLQLVKYDLASGEMTQITDGTSRNQWPLWSPDGKWVAYHSNRRNAADFDLHIVQPGDPKSDRVVAEVSGIWHVMAWSPDAKSLLVYEDSGSSQSRLWRFDAKTGDRKLLTAQTGARWSTPRYTPDGKFIYAVGGGMDADVPGLWRFTVSAGAWKQVSTPGAYVEDFDLSSDGKLAAIVYQRDANSALQVVDLPSMRARRIPSLPPGQILSVSWRPHSHEVGITYRSVARFADVFSIEPGKDEATRWTESSTGTFDASVLPPPEIIRWKSFDGRTISGILYKPPARFQGPRPVIVNIHGGPVNQERPRFLGRSYYFLNEDGI
ncbi:MAG: peptidase S9, prolyl oligopeptidase, partial [Acidobacteria bacterium]